MLEEQLACVSEHRAWGNQVWCSSHIWGGYVLSVKRTYNEKNWFMHLTHMWGTQLTCLSKEITWSFESWVHRIGNSASPHVRVVKDESWVMCHIAHTTISICKCEWYIQRNNIFERALHMQWGLLAYVTKHKIGQYLR